MKNIKICFISDTHNKHKKFDELPKADVIVHSGDFSSMGYEHEIRNFFKWFSNLKQYKYKIIIAGNHEILFEKNTSLAKTLIPDNVIYLEDSGVEIDGIEFYGSPVSLPFLNWAFMRPKERIKRHWEAIPDNVDVLITHTPPYGILDYYDVKDEYLGCPTLRDEIFNRIKPKISVFGHIHTGRGTLLTDNITFINATNTEEIERKYVLQYKPILVELNNGIVNVLSK